MNNTLTDKSYKIIYKKVRYNIAGILAIFVFAKSPEKLILFSEVKQMKGSYVLLIKVNPMQNIRVGRLGIFDFKPGFYAYVGSALNNLEKRIERHLRAKKKNFWHIDYLLEKAEILDVFRVESIQKLECPIAEKLSKQLHSVPNFGSSECRCMSHLFYHENRKILKGLIEEAIDGILK